MKLDNPLLVGWEYASEERFAKRSSLFHALLVGDNPDDLAYDTVAEARPGRVLDAGCGLGATAERFATELGADVKAIDLSPRMVELTRARGADVQVGDVQHLPFADGEFTTIDRAHLAPLMPEIHEPFRATTTNVIFIAEKGG